MKKYNKKCAYCGNGFVSENPDKKYCRRTHAVKAQNIRKRETEKSNFVTIDNTSDFNFVEEITIVRHSEHFAVTTGSGTDIVGNYNMYSTELQFLDGVLISMKPNGLLITGHYDSDNDTNEEICYVFDNGELIVGSSRSQIEDYLNG